MPSLASNRRAALRLLLGGATLALAGCGRKGSPIPPYDVDPCSGRHYPMSEGAKQACAQKQEYAREHPPQPPPPKGQKRSSAKPAEPAPPSSQPQSEPATPNPPSNAQPQ